MTDKKVKVVKREKGVKPEKLVKLEKPVKPEKSVKLEKSVKPEKKRLSKGLRTHNRRMKQEARNPSIVHG